MEPSVGSIGDGYDKALAETIDGLFKAETHRPPADPARFALTWVSRTAVLLAGTEDPRRCCGGAPTRHCE